MSMIGEYARLTPAELDRVLEDPDWAQEFVEERIEHETATDGPEGAARTLDIDKSWDMLGHLLRRLDFPVDVVHGEAAVEGADDWGYGPPCYLTADRVRTAAEAMAALPGAVLVKGVTATELDEAELYPTAGTDGAGAAEWLDYVVHHYDALAAFFTAAARAGDAMLVWLD
ncbi:YfbM family protein [Actinacidiphila alni]|uniref:YfbM family protein n=1 Tax=Actinacidiphila alni TaxID=380248 RepID=UPI0033D76AF2